MLSEIPRRECENCGVMYAPLDEAQKFCEPRCGHAYSRRENKRRRRERHHQVCPRPGKKIIPTEEVARQRAIETSKRAGYPVYYYPCQGCGKWHLTKKPSFLLERARGISRKNARRIDRAVRRLDDLENMSVVLSQSVHNLSLVIWL